MGAPMGRRRARQRPVGDAMIAIYWARIGHETASRVGKYAASWGNKKKQSHS